MGGPKKSLLGWEEMNTTDPLRVDLSVANRIEQVLQRFDLADSRRDTFVRKALAILRKDQYEEETDGIKANAE